MRPLIALLACVQTDEPLENIRVAEKHVRFLWRWILMPLLFCLIGTIINFNQLPSSTIVKAVGLIFAGEALELRLLLHDFAAWHVCMLTLPNGAFAFISPMQRNATEVLCHSRKS